ncbi:MAG: hypothetical protein K8U57_23835 [Planctomycetes bacterium]|nr:hypothetical protein [Planctomycetota bacterium]
MVTKRRLRWLLGVMALALLGGASWYLWPAAAPAPQWTADYDVAAKPPEKIPPGTVVGTTPPEGWSHLVIKSLPRVRPDQESKIPRLARSQTVRMTRWMFTAFVADVRPETRGDETRYQLRAIALGLGTTVGGKDVVITAETAPKHGVQLDWITKQIITQGYQIQALAVVVVQGPTFALMDTPVWFRCGEVNKLIRYRYALLVDSKTGQLDVLLWPLDASSNCFDSAKAVLLKPNEIDEAELVPDPKGFDVLGIATASTFGVDHLPNGTPLVVSEELRDLTTKTKFTPEEARTLEASLREFLAGLRK